MFIVSPIFRNDFNLNVSSRHSRQINRNDALLSGLSSRDKTDHPTQVINIYLIDQEVIQTLVHFSFFIIAILIFQEPSGEKTRKTYDFTKTYHVGLSCHDIQASQGDTAAR